jgi:metal-responsive CopG/Arc/MetJ family transcriptional regulator
MPRIRGANVQIWGTVSQETADEIDEIAERERRKKTDVVAMLIENALKERRRQRKKNSKDDDQ